MLGAVLGGVLGAIGGAAGTPSSSNGTQSSSVNLRSINDLNQGRSGLETAGDNASLDQFNQLLNLANAGPGASSVTDALGASNNYANMLQSYISNGGAPTAQNLSTAQNYAGNVFAPQQTALNQQFYNQNIDAQRMAARLGRPGNDPILANKLAFSQSQMQQQLESQKSSFGAQYADQLQGRNLDLGSSLMNVRNGLAQQAFTNRNTLLQLGQQLTQNERNYRLGAAGRTTNTSQSGSQGGGLGGAIGGALAGIGGGAGTEAKLGSFDFGSMFGGGGGGSSGNNQLQASGSGAVPRAQSGGF